MNEAPWLHKQRQELLNLSRANTAPVLAYGHEPAALLEFIENVVAAELCEASTPAESKPCGKCPACQMRLAGNHPDLQFIFPQALALEKGLPVEVKTGVKPSQEIRVDDIRGMQAFFNTASSRGGNRYALIYPFEQINLNSANSLLKTLEEPMAGLRFFLIGHKPEQLLPTIRSRCQLFRGKEPSLIEALDWLNSHKINQPEVCLSLAGNDPFEALRLSNTAPDDLDLRKKWMDWLSSPQAHGQIPPNVEKAGFPVLLELGMRLLSDLMAVNQKQNCVQFPWLAPKLLWAKRLNMQRLSDVYQTYQDQYKIAQHPLNPRLALEFIAQRWQTLYA